MKSSKTGRPGGGGTFRFLKAACVALLLMGGNALAADPAAPGAVAPSAKAPPSGPRGQPIRPPAFRLTNTVPGTVVTLPGGILITNLPQSVLPKGPTNTVRLPTWAARRFEPLGFAPTSFTVLARFFPDVGSTNAASPLPAEARWPELRKQIPEDVLALDGRKVALAGFILPLALQDGRTTRFLLLRSQSACCFGLMPRVNELVVVNVAAPGVRPRPDTPFVVGGRFQVKWVGLDGQLISLYQMEADKVEAVESF